MGGLGRHELSCSTRLATTMENQMEKKMENEMETRVIYLIYIGGNIGVILGIYWDNGK